jgi:hypothetical protein
MPWQLSGNGRNGWSTKLIRGLKAEAAAASSRDGSGVVNRPPSPLNMLLSRHTRRREFITVLSGAAIWSLAVRAQQPERMRLIGILLPAAVGDPIFEARLAAFQQELARLGWTVGRNARIDTRHPLTARNSPATMALSEASGHGNEATRLHHASRRSLLLSQTRPTRQAVPLDQS